MSIIVKNMYNYAELSSGELASPCSLTLLRAGVRPELSHWDIPLIVRTEWVLFHNSSGKAVVLFGKQEIPLTPQRIVLIPPFTPYSTILPGKACHHFLWFRTAGLYDTPARRPFVLDRKDAADELETLLQQAMTPRTVEALRLFTRRLLLQIPEDFFADQAGLDPRIRETLRLMSMEPTRLANGELAAKLHMSEGNFNHLFKQETGLSPQRCLMQLRLARAVALLDGGMEIREIAEKCGFADRYHFSKLFKEHYGLPPGRWRHQEEKDEKNSLFSDKRLEKE